VALVLDFSNRQIGVDTIHYSIKQEHKEARNKLPNLSKKKQISTIQINSISHPQSILLNANGSSSTFLLLPLPNSR
jgi:hypothetical protein